MNQVKGVNENIREGKADREKLHLENKELRISVKES
jgi:hypothetical protein